MIGGLGVGELVIILVIVLLIFGPNKLGDVGSAIGRGISGFKKAMQDKDSEDDKDEDTMLAQLADGEFVSRADAVLGAGILSGGDPKSYKSMRKAGADFFYDQQKKFKRIYDLVNENKSDTIQ